MLPVSAAVQIRSHRLAHPDMLESLQLLSTPLQRLRSFAPMKSSRAQMNLVAFNRLNVVGCDAQQPIR
jgi:hypothetical protein